MIIGKERGAMTADSSQVTCSGLENANNERQMLPLHRSFCHGQHQKLSVKRVT